jgi:hypothetical protein
MFRRPAPCLGPLILTFSVVAGACSSPPEKEHEQAQSAITSAQAADAIQYAPDDLQRALGSLKAYDAAVAQGDYRLALSHAITARDLAYAAAKLATERKQAAKLEADRAIVELNGLVMMAKSRLAANPPPAPAVAERLRKALARTPTLLQEASTRLQKQDFKGVVGLVQPMTQTMKKDLTPPAGRKGK